jgi:hypothetical protein
MAPSVPPASTTTAHQDPPRLIRSHRVRKLVKLERQARRQMDRAAQALASAERSLGRALALRRQARALEVTFTGSQLGELLRVRSESLGRTGPRSSTAPSAAR